VPRDVVATGDQGTVADAICPLQPVTALVYANAPGQHVVNFTVSGISGLADQQAKVLTAIDDTLRQYGSVGGGNTIVDLGLVEAAIAAVVANAVVTAPAANIVTPAGQLPVRGTVTFS
jgi:hypothetical protein